MRAIPLSLSLGLLLTITGYMAPSLVASDRAWSTAATSGYFSDNNWCDGNGGSAGGYSVDQGDLLFFNTSSIQTLTNNLVDFTFQSLTFNDGAGAFTIGGNSFGITGGLFNSGANSQTILSGLALNASQVTIQTVGDVILDGVLSGTASELEKTGTGRLTLSGTNTYAGKISVKSGNLALARAAAIAKTRHLALGTLLSGVSATLDVSGLTEGFHVLNGQTLSGVGTVNAAITVDLGGTLAVTEGYGTPRTLTVNNGVTLNGTTLLSVKRGNGADLIQVNGDTDSVVRFGGTLVLTNLGDLISGDTFTLFSAPNYIGEFTGLLLRPWPDTGLRVDISRLRTDGTIKVTRNSAPVAGNVQLSVERNGTVSFDLAKYASDPDGDFLTARVDRVDDGDKITFTNGTVTYRPASGVTGARSFTYYADDPSGAASGDPGTVTVSVTPPSENGGNILSVSGGGGPPVTVTFAGIPGAVYQVQYSTDLNTWADVGAPVTVGSNGKAVFQHVPDPSPTGYYRTRYVNAGN